MARRINERFLEKWADALAESIGTDERTLDRWIFVLDLIAQLRKVRSARSFALDGRYSLEDKISFFSNLLKESLGEELPQPLDVFVVPLLEGDLWDGITALKKAVLSRFDERIGRIVVEIHSAAPLTSEEQKKILEGLLRFVNEGPGRELAGALQSDRKISIKAVWTVQAELIAGLEIRIGSRVWDASLSARIRELGRQLLKSA